MKENRTELTASHQTMIILWAALLISQFIFVFVLYVVKPELFRFDLDQPIFGEDPILVIVLAAAALISVGASFVWRSKLRQQAFAEQKVVLLQSGLIVAMALCEAATLFGLVLAFAFDYQYFFLWFALGIFGMLLHFPKFSDILAATYKTNLDNNLK